MSAYIKTTIPYLISILILVLVSTILLWPQLEGKVIVGEGVQNSGMMKEAQDYHLKNKEFTFWTNSMFSGMPTYLMYGGAKSGLLQYVANTLMLFREDSLGYLIVFSLSIFFGLLFFKLNPWIALLGSIAATFATTHIGVLEAGHNGKLASSGFSVLLIASLYLFSIKEYIAGGLAFLMGLALSIAFGHPQMTYYSLIGFGIVALFFLVDLVRSKDFKSAMIMGAIGMISLLLSLGANLYQSYTVRKFSEDTMRGGSILSSQLQNQSGSNSSESGLGYDYAMGWSDGIKDLRAFIIPGAVGGSNNEYVQGNKRINDLLRKNGLQAQSYLPLYWGDLTFTGSPDYVGIIIVLLFLLGIVYIKGFLRWGLLSSVVFLILMSLGKNFDAFNRFLFDYLPMLNKFRTPNSIHNVSVCLVSLYAVLGLNAFLESKDPKAVTNLFKIGGGLILYVLIFGLAGGMFYDFSSIADNRYDTKIVSIFKEARSIYLSQDSIRTLLFLVAGLIPLYLFLKGKLSKTNTIVLLALLTLFDLFSVAKRYINKDDWKKSSTLKNAIPMRACDQQILADKTLHYRVHDLSSGDPFQSATSAYYHKLIGGYNPAKFRRYQDVIDAYLAKGDEKMLNMLNAKYVITQEEQVITRPGAYGNAWFVNNIKFVQSPDEEIAAVSTIDPLQTAILLEKEFSGYVSPGMNFDKSGSISLTSYQPNLLTYNVDISTDQFAVFSEVWYGSGKGWEAYLDGKPIDHVRVNYILRGLKIPAGKHTIEFKFHPKSVISSIQIGFWFSNLVGLLIIGLLGWIVYNDYKKFEKVPIAASPGLNPVQKQTRNISKGKK